MKMGGGGDKYGRWGGEGGGGQIGGGLQNVRYVVIIMGTYNA